MSEDTAILHLVRIRVAECRRHAEEETVRALWAAAVSISELAPVGWRLWRHIGRFKRSAQAMHAAALHAAAAASFEVARLAGEKALAELEKGRCNAPHPFPSWSPCVLAAGHTGDHRDDHMGGWANIAKPTADG